MDNLVKKICVARRNKSLCKRYPFLIPWNRFSGKLITECQKGERGYWPGNPDKIPKYDWSFTELDDMPQGWRDAFGIQMCEEIRQALIEDDYLENWRIVQMKEKYGELRLYDSGTRKNSRVPEIIEKYTVISRRTCIVCGKPATKMTVGWISPYCDKCCPDRNAVPIDEYYDSCTII